MGDETERDFERYSLLLAANQYQQFTKSTAIYPRHKGVEYCALGLASEVGETCGKLKKFIRDGGPLDTDAIKAELGDVCWYVARLADELGIDFGKVLWDNVEKLESRKQRGTIGGSGDVR